MRANLRKAFNSADEGRTVLIERYGQVFQLVSLVNPEKPVGSSSVVERPAVDREVVGSSPTSPAIFERNIKRTKEQTDNFTLTGPSCLEGPEGPGIANIPAGPTRGLNGLCKVHGTPLDDTGRCLVKGCKNG